MQVSAASLLCQLHSTLVVDGWADNLLDECLKFGGAHGDEHSALPLPLRHICNCHEFDHM